MVGLMFVYIMLDKIVNDPAANSPISEAVEFLLVVSFAGATLLSLATAPLWIAHALSHPDRTNISGSKPKAALVLALFFIAISWLSTLGWITLNSFAARSS
jgi:hypothetical protein